MFWFVDLPLAVRLLLLLLVGVASGSVINWAIYRLAYGKRSISPWSAPPQDAPPRVWTDRIPIYGWLGLARESEIHGRGFWVRPLLIELGFALALAALYWWNAVSGAYLTKPIAVQQILAALPFVPDLVAAAHLRFLAQSLLLLLMVVATFIDIDEKTIPDAVAVTGTAVGLLFAIFLPWSQLTHVVRIHNLAPGLPQLGVVIDGLFFNVVSLLTFASPSAPPTGTWSRGALGIGIACYLLWCFSLLDRRWAPRLPLHRAVWLFVARATYGGIFLRTALMAAVGTIGIYMTWRHGSVHWLGLFNALIGMTVGGGIVWAVRVIGRVTLKKEAMGFGDVTLMAMIGTFVGWQGCLFIFFLAPFAGLVVGLAQFGLNLKAEIPYGPFLCLATVVVVTFWSRFWHEMEPYFRIPWLIPGVMGVCMVAMIFVLALMQIGKRRLGYAD